MISRNLLTGTVVLLAASLANAGPCHPSSIASSSTVITSVSETATSSFEGEAATSTASIDATQTATTATESESESETGTTFIVETTSTVSSVETTTTALVDTTTAAPVITSVDTTTEATTTTAAATTTSEEPEALQTIYLYAGGSNDPALSPLGGTGFTALGDTSLPDVEYIDFTTDTTSALFFTTDTTSALFVTLGERTGKVKIGNGANVGKLAGYSTSGDFSLVIVAETTLAEENGISPLDCEIIDGNGFQMLQCQYGDKGVADLWTCAGHLTLVKPGVDFTSMCARAATAYKLGYIQVVDY